jgi:hypothetical protein
LVHGVSSKEDESECETVPSRETGESLVLAAPGKVAPSA